MALDNPNKLQQILAGVQETGKLLTGRSYNLSMVKARQTLEWMIKFLSGRENFADADMSETIDALFQNNIISKASCENYHKIRLIGNKAVHEEDNNSYNADVAYSLLQEEVATFEKQYYKVRTLPTARRPVPKPQNAAKPAPKTVRRTTRKRPAPQALDTGELRKVLIGFALLVVVIFIFVRVSPLARKNTTVKTSQATGDESTIEAAPTPEETASQIVVSTYVTTARVNVRSTPSTDGDVIATLQYGTSLEYVGEHDASWSIINYNGTQAYVASAYIKPQQ